MIDPSNLLLLSVDSSAVMTYTSFSYFFFLTVVVVVGGGGAAAVGRGRGVGEVGEGREGGVSLQHTKELNGEARDERFYSRERKKKIQSH